MGLPALQHRHTAETTRRTSRGSSSTRRPSKARSGKKRPAAKGSARRSAPSTHARRRTRRDPSRAAFAAVCLLLCALAIFGLGRVAVAAQATEASFEANQIREDIKAERLTGQLLEVDKSALTTPSRIEAIAGSTMKMADANDVCYLALPQGRRRGCRARGEPGSGEFGGRQPPRRTVVSCRPLWTWPPRRRTCSS